MFTRNFRNVEMSISLTNAYGHYLIEAIYRGELIRVITTDSKAFDCFYDDQSTKQKEALRHCYRKIKQASDIRVNTY